MLKYMIILLGAGILAWYAFDLGASKKDDSDKMSLKAGGFAINIGDNGVSIEAGEGISFKADEKGVKMKAGDDISFEAGENGVSVNAGEGVSFEAGENGMSMNTGEGISFDTGSGTNNRVKRAAPRKIGPDYSKIGPQ
ncbi:MAG: hypothetical protein GY804_04390 [Alphaproteobacteria bacterium]|nr:hypothetical protein [Alphaproteobacteria bacterium]